MFAVHTIKSGHKFLRGVQKPLQATADKIININRIAYKYTL